MSSIPRETWKLALMIGLPLAVPLAIAAAVAAGPLAGLAAFVALFAFTTSILAVVTLSYATIMTRGGARSPEGVVTGEYAEQFDVGGRPEDAFARTKAGVEALPGAKILVADAAAGILEAETSIGPYVQRIHVRVEGTTVNAIAKHQPGRKLFDFGAGGKQLADLRRALEVVPADPEVEVTDRDPRREAARAAQRLPE